MSAATTALQIALQEYSYWRDCGNGGEQPSPTMLEIQLGALGASANIAARIAGGNLEGIHYRQLSEIEVARSLRLIAAAPKMLDALEAALNELHEVNLTRSYGNPPRNPEMTVAAEAKVRIAIEKAKGGAA